MDRLVQNIRVGYRGLRRTPGFAVAAILTLALGIGLSTAVFTVADALLLRRLPVHDQDHLVVLWGETRDRRVDNFPLGLSDAREFARQSRSLDRAAFFFRQGAWPVLIRDAGRMSRMRLALVSGGFLDVLGARPALGRTLRPSDDVIGAAPVLVLSHTAWQQRFGGDTGVIGRQVMMHESGATYRVVGVMPQGLDYPRGTDFWAPLVPPMTRPGADSTFAELDVLGRLSPGATSINARDELSAFFARPEAPYRKLGVSGVVHTLSQVVLGDTRPALFVFAAAAALLLLITCINVANLLLVRGLGRMREIAVRSALGAARWQIVLQLLLENSLLAVAGGAAGLAIAAGAVRAFVVFAPPGVPRLDEIQLNTTALAGAVGITAVAMLLF
jgi:predicted permease